MHVASYIWFVLTQTGSGSPDRSWLAVRQPQKRENLQNAQHRQEGRLMVKMCVFFSFMNLMRSKCFCVSFSVALIESFVQFTVAPWTQHALRITELRAPLQYIIEYE